MPIIDEFDVIDEQSWKKLLCKALKINSLDDFPTRIVQGVEIPSFNHASTEKTSMNPLQTSNLDWIIGLSVDLASDNAHAMALNGVQNGSEALILRGINPDWNHVYNGIYHEMIYNDLRLTEEKGLSQFIAYSLEADKNLDSLSGSFMFSLDALKANIDDLKKLPQFHFVTIQFDTENIPEELLHICASLQKAIEKCMALELNHKIIRVATNVDMHLAVNVSKLRAIRVLWANLLKANKLAFTPLFIVANTKVDASANKETKLIQNTLACLNAALGTADLICTQAQKEINSDRLNQNIQHIMKLESKLNMVRDPLAGSYAIEKMTKNLAEAAWKSMIKNSATFE